MILTNLLYEQAWYYSELHFVHDLDGLNQIQSHCKTYKEKICYESKLLDVDFHNGETFSDWLFLGDYDDEHQYMLRLYNEWHEIETDEISEKNIYIGLRENEYCVHGLNDYLHNRQEYLTESINALEFSSFMQSCFANLTFSDHVYQSLKQIRLFREYVPFIVKDLQVLDDYALSVFLECKEDMQKAISIISAKVTECSNDQKHKDDLMFRFRGKTNEGECDIMVCCQTHTKVKERYSDVRIYFKWNDERVEGGRKVLIGRIGTHPY